MTVAVAIFRVLSPLVVAVVVTVWRCRVLDRRRDEQLDKRLARLNKGLEERIDERR